MARITVEDCLKMVDNQFDLVMTAAKRARMIANGAEPLVEIENDKPTVIALREIAAGLISEEIMANMKQPVEDILSSEEAEELLANTPIPGQHDSRSMPAREKTPAIDTTANDLLADAIAAELAAATEAAAVAAEAGPENPFEDAPAKPAAEAAPEAAAEPAAEAPATEADKEDKPASE